MSEINTSEIAGVAISTLIKECFRDIVSVTGHRFSNIYQRIFQDFEPFMSECYRRNRHVRILCQGDDDVDLLEIYVATNFSHRKSIVPETELAFRVGEGQNIVVLGAGGAGKTFFMRKLWLDLLVERKFTPLFIELRKLNELSSTSLEAFIRASISGNLSKELFERFCGEGRFAMIFDGFDELPKSLHEDLQAQILRLSDKFPHCALIVSSRPDARFHGWASFKVFEAQPFSLEQTRELCRKVPFEEEYRRKFIKQLDDEFYSRYADFLSNPLLSIMMMMTFRANMSIPSKTGIFYDQAFETLYQRHDSTKAFKRAKNLDIQEFQRAFGSFCLLSYMREKFDFSRAELYTTIEESRAPAGIDVDKELILDDFERSVNLIRQDGMRYYFIHRSFQEYFAAWALVHLFDKKFRDICYLIEHRVNDEVMKMCFELKPLLTVADYIEPRLEKFSDRIGFRRGLEEYDVFERFVDSISVGVSDATALRTLKRAPIGVSVMSDPEFSNFIDTIRGIMFPDRKDRILMLNFGPLLTFEMFEVLNDWTRQIEGVTDGCRVDFKASLRDGTVEGFLRRSDGEDTLRRPGTGQAIVVSDEQLAVLKLGAKEVVKDLLEIEKWCRDQIRLLKTRNQEIDRLFLA